MVVRLALMFNRLVDVIQSILDGPRASGAFVLRVAMASPWALRIEDRAPLAVVAVVRGSIVLAFDDGEVATAGRGDVVLVRGPDPYLVADSMGRSVTAVVDADGHCHTRLGAPLDAHMSLGVRTWGNASDVAEADAMMLLATYTMAGEIGDAIARSLPRVTVIPVDDDPLRALFERELGRDTSGQAAILDRLADLLLVSSMRTWLARPGHEVPRWLAEQSDQPVQQSIRLMHNNLSRPWTVAGLAREVGLSRAAFSRRFSAAIGESPMRHLTARRLSVAADLLVGTDRSVESIAREVGYGSAFALSAAYSRDRGCSPTAFRRAARRAE